MIFVIIALLIAFLSGYIIGRRIGMKDGMESGLSYAPLLIRKESLKDGHCLICKTPVDCYKSTSMIE